jgi:SAM-dependent methyltransferase
MKAKTAQEWDRMARHYHAFVEDATSYSRMIILPALSHLLPELAGKKVLDAGCGSGHSTFFIEQFNPSKIIGIDLSSEMIRMAEVEKSERGSQAEFQLGDVEDLSRFEAASFDLLVSINVTHFLPALESFGIQCARLLKPGGVMIWGIIHPLYSALYPIARPDGSFPNKEDWQVRYHDKSLRIYVQPWIERAQDSEPFLSSSYHYTYSDYFNALHAAGLVMTALEEPVPLDEFRQAHPTRYAAYMRIPTFALLKAEKR